MQLAPLGLRQRSVPCVTPLEVAAAPDREAHGRDAVHAILPALKEAVEEPQLQVLAPLGVERVAVRTGVHDEPFVGRGSTAPALDVAAQMKGASSELGVKFIAGARL